MRDMYNIETTGATSGVGLLVSILLRYPEVSTVKYEPEANTLDFSFMVREVVDIEKFNTFREEYFSSINVFWDVIRMNDSSTLELSCEVIEGLTKLVVTRDISTLTSEEISLSMALLFGSFGDSLISDRSEELLEEDMLTHEEIIRNLLADVNESVLEKKLIGYREEGRVVVFNRTAGSN